MLLKKYLTGKGPTKTTPRSRTALGIAAPNFFLRVYMSSVPLLSVGRPPHNAAKNFLPPNASSAVLDSGRANAKAILPDDRQACQQAIHQTRSFQQLR